MREVVRSLRFRLLLLVLLALVPVWALIVDSLLRYGQNETREWFELSSQRVSFVAQGEAAFFGNVEKVLSAAALSEQLRSGDQAVCLQFLEALHQQNPGYRSLYVVDTNGELWCGAPALNKRFNVRERPYFKGALQGKHFTVGAVFVEEKVPFSLFVFAYPLQDRSGAIRGVLCATLNFESMKRFVEKVQGGQRIEDSFWRSTVLSSVDEQGMVQLRYPDPEKWVAKPFSEPAVLASLRQQTNGVVEARSSENQDTLFAFHEIPTRCGSEKAWLVFQIPKEVVLGHYRHVVRKDLTMLGLISSLALIIAWCCSHWFVLRGVRRLLEAVSRLEKGEFQVRVGPVPGVSEVKTLGRAFDQMASALGHREEERKHNESILREGEARYRALFENSALGVFIVQESVVLDCNEQACHMLGCAREELIGHRRREFYPPHQPDGSDSIEVSTKWDRLAFAGHPQSYLWQYVRKDGQCLDTEVTIKSIRMGTESLLVVTAQDLTDLRRAEQALQELSGRLLRLQDEERRSIARELHDNTAQWLAALSMNLTLFDASAERLSEEGRKQLADCHRLLEHCSREVRTLSYLLHPPLLDQLGLVEAIQEYAEGFAKRSGIQVEVQLPAERLSLSQEVELALFRILQECLANIHRHSGSPTAVISLRTESNELRLEVCDEGRGMPWKQTSQAGNSPRKLGVGITGMRERLRQLGGVLEIDSQSSGTVVRARIPLSG